MKRNPEDYQEQILHGQTWSGSQEIHTEQDSGRGDHCEHPALRQARRAGINHD